MVLKLVCYKNGYDDFRLKLSCLFVCWLICFVCVLVFFWAPAMKWGLVIAGIRDFTRPVDLVSVPQCFGKRGLKIILLFE